MGVSDPRHPPSKTASAEPTAQTLGDATADDDDYRATLPLAPTRARPPRSPPSGELALRGEQHRTIGRYVLLRELGEGAMGVVYAAYDEELDRKVALKIIHPSRQGDSQLRTRILREAQALARVSAPNVVQVYQVGEVDGQLFIAMEFVNGTTLTRWQAEPGRSWQDILRMYIAAGQGVLAAHQAELVHRDFKPDNVLIGKDDRPRVADFGLARFEGKVGSADASGTMRVPTIDPIGGPGGGPSDGPPIAPLHPSLTQVGMVMGTPLYMSPEQHLGKPADSRSDQFSFCVALYEALYQQVPFGGTTREDLAVNAVLGKVLPRPPGSNVPTPVHEALLRGLSCAPEQRFPSMRELLAALTYDPAVDLAAGPRSRRRVILSMFALSFTTVLGVPLLGLLGIGPFAGSVLTALVFLGVFVFLTVRFRHEMRSNIFHRATLVYGLVFGGQALFLRALGHLLGLSYSQVVTLDLAAVAATSCFMASMLMPNLWPLVPLNLVAALAAAQLPGFAEEIASASIALTLLGATLRWNNKVATRGPGGRHPLYPEKFPSGPYAKPPVTRRAKSG